MRRVFAVQRKTPCLFLTQLRPEEPSPKREQQPFKVLATETINHKALDADIYNAIPTEKVDGTCCYVTTYKGRPYLWARLDRKPNKQAEKRFKRFLYSKENTKEFVWNVEEDFKPVPERWIPAKEIEYLNGNPVPDENGHIPGWLPVEKNNKQYCWHSSVVNYEFETALVLNCHAGDPGLLEISAVPLSDLLEQTLELIGTNINANPYGMYSVFLFCGRKLRGCSKSFPLKAVRRVLGTVYAQKYNQGNDLRVIELDYGASTLTFISYYGKFWDTVECSGWANST